MYKKFCLRKSACRKRWYRLSQIKVSKLHKTPPFNGNFDKQFTKNKIELNYFNLCTVIPSHQNEYIFVLLFNTPASFLLLVYVESSFLAKEGIRTSCLLCIRTRRWQPSTPAPLSITITLLITHTALHSSLWFATLNINGYAAGVWEIWARKPGGGARGRVSVDSFFPPPPKN